MKQKIILLNQKNRKDNIFPVELRKLFAKSELFGEEFFNYKDGKTNQSLSPIVMTKQGMVGIVAQGQEGMNILTKELENLIAFIEKSALFTGFELKSNELSGYYSEKPYKYSIKSYVVACSLTEERIFKNLPKSEQVAFLKIKIERDIKRYATRWGIDLVDEDLRIFVSEDSLVDENYSYMVHQSKQDGYKKSIMVIRNMRFVANLKINGFWALGRFSSSGNGRLWYER